MTVYVVTSGSYSSYCIEAVFLDEEKAKFFAEANSPFSDLDYYDAWRVEEFDTIDDSIEINRREVPYFDIKLNALGEMIDCHRLVYIEYPNDKYTEKFKYNERTHEFEGCTKDTAGEEAAIKVMQDRRAEYLAKLFGVKV